MATTFKNIPDVERKVYKRTSMNEILLFFTYTPISLVNNRNVLENELKAMELSISRLQLNSNEGKDDLIEYQDGDVTVSLTNVGVLVNIPVTRYRDFTTTEFVWNHLEQVLRVLHVNPIIWSFSKGNRFVFAKPVAEEAKKSLLSVILSEELLKQSNDKGVYVVESDDRTCVFSCRYGFEKYKEQDALSLKTMISSQSYEVNGLTKQVMAMNELMFDVWHWTMSPALLKFMDAQKE